MSSFELNNIDNEYVVELAWENKSDDGEILHSGIATGIEHWSIENINLDIGNNEITLFAKYPSWEVALEPTTLIIYEPIF